MRIAEPCLSSYWPFFTDQRKAPRKAAATAIEAATITKSALTKGMFLTGVKLFSGRSVVYDVQQSKR
jgi:hypothetical protein